MPSLLSPTKVVLSLKKNSLFIIFFVICFSSFYYVFSDFVPIWDGRLYANAVSDAAHRFQFNKLSPFNHPSHGYFSFFVLAEMLFPCSVAAFSFVVTVFYYLAIVSFYGILKTLVGAKTSRFELMLLTALFALHPVFLSTSINFNLDLGLVAYFLGLIWALTQKKDKFSVLLACLLVFTKEPGIALLGLSLMATQVFYFRSTWQIAVKKSVKTLVGPILLIIAYGIYRNLYVPSQQVLWGTSFGDLIGLVLKFYKMNRTLRANLFEIFGFNFNWIVTTTIVVTLFSTTILPLLLNRVGRKQISRTRLQLASSESFLLILLLLVTYFLTRLPTFLNIRYMLPAIAVLFLTFAVVLINRVNQFKRRFIVAISFLIIFLIANFRTLDPVSWRYFGVFLFGKNEMLNMTSTTSECCGKGRDQIVYNLQFMKLSSIQNLIYENIRPNSSTHVIMHPFSNYWTNGFMLAGPLDPIHFHRIWRDQDVVMPHYGIVDDLKSQQVKPVSLYYIELPMFDSSNDIAYLRSIYTQESHKTYGDDGHSLLVYYFYQ